MCSFLLPPLNLNPLVTLTSPYALKIISYLKTRNLTDIQPHGLGKNELNLMKKDKEKVGLGIKLG